jgi:hypothetical protein
MKDLFLKSKPILESHRSRKHVEFEMRLGKINNNMFDTNVGEKAFNTVLMSLKVYKGWESIKETTSSVYYKGSNRMTIDEDTDEVMTVRKQKLQVVDQYLKDRPFDVRFCVSEEIPLDMDISDEVMDHVRHKKRISFVRKNLSIDMTVVSGDPDDLDDENEESYEIEFEIIDPTKVMDNDTFYNMLYKVECILKTLRPNPEC